MPSPTPSSGPSPAPATSPSLGPSPVSDQTISRPSTGQPQALAVE